MTDTNNNTSPPKVNPTLPPNFPQILLGYMEQLMVDNGYTNNDLTKDRCTALPALEAGTSSRKAIELASSIDSGAVKTSTVTSTREQEVLKPMPVLGTRAKQISRKGKGNGNNTRTNH